MNHPLFKTSPNSVQVLQWQFGALIPFELDILILAGISVSTIAL